MEMERIGLVCRKDGNSRYGSAVSLVGPVAAAVVLYAGTPGMGQGRLTSAWLEGLGEKGYVGKLPTRRALAGTIREKEYARTRMARRYALCAFFAAPR